MPHQAVQRKTTAQISGIPVPAVRRASAAAVARDCAIRVPLDASDACNLAVCLSATHFELPQAALIATPRGPRRLSRARHVAIYLAHVTLGLPLGVVAAQFRRDRSTAAYACRLVEDLRERPAFDAALATLEFAAKAAAEESQS
jgi:Bacterial dnaA protein helix-turn-helix